MADQAFEELDRRLRAAQAGLAVADDALRAAVAGAWLERDPETRAVLATVSRRLAGESTRMDALRRALLRWGMRAAVLDTESGSQKTRT